MAGELTGASFEAPKKLENLDGSPLENPDLGLEKKESVAEQPSEAIPERPTISPAVAAPVASASPFEQRGRQIESVMAKGLEEIYMSLPPEKKAEFKRVGEETAVKVNLLLEKTKVNIGKVVNLIKKWLSLLPGVNKMFLEQEAKIRSDEILKLRKKE
jgi:hypothetical protein